MLHFIYFLLIFCYLCLRVVLYNDNIFKTTELINILLLFSELSLLEVVVADLAVE